MTSLVLTGTQLVRMYDVRQAPSFMHQAQELRPHECTLIWSGAQWTAYLSCRGVGRGKRCSATIHFDAGYKPVAMPTWLNNLILDTSPGGVS